MAVEHRDHREIKINPEGTDDGTLPRLFRLDVLTARQERDGRSRAWRDATPRVRATLAEHLTRRDLEAFIAEAASWLAWDGTDN